MSTIASQITSLTIVYSIVYSDADQRKHQSSASLAFVSLVNSPHKWPVTRKIFRFDDVIMLWNTWINFGAIIMGCNCLSHIQASVLMSQSNEGMPGSWRQTMHANVISHCVSANLIDTNAIRYWNLYHDLQWPEDIWREINVELHDWQMEVNAGKVFRKYFQRDYNLTSNIWSLGHIHSVGYYHFLWIPKTNQQYLQIA